VYFVWIENFIEFRKSPTHQIQSKISILKRNECMEDPKRIIGIIAIKIKYLSI
jgi:hypothetical protein